MANGARTNMARLRGRSLKGQRLHAAVPWGHWRNFAAAYASIHNHCNHDRHLYHRDIFKRNRAAALAVWRQLAV